MKHEIRVCAHERLTTVRGVSAVICGDGHLGGEERAREHRMRPRRYASLTFCANPSCEYVLAQEPG